MEHESHIAELHMLSFGYVGTAPNGQQTVSHLFMVAVRIIA